MANDISILGFLRKELLGESTAFYGGVFSFCEQRGNTNRKGVFLLLKQKRKRKRYNIIRGKTEIETLIDRLPEDEECFKFISDGGFSSICFILYIAEKTVIKNLYVASFAVSKREMQTLNLLNNKGRLLNAELHLGSIMNRPDTALYKTITKIAEEKGFKLRFSRNHAKVFLFDTDAGKFVIETSSNLNENPQIEQFSFEKDTELYEFYKKNLFNAGE